MHFHRAADDGARVRAVYDSLTDAVADAPYPPGWRKGVYPTQAFLDASIAHGELFLAELDGALVGCMVLNHAYNDGYAAVTWAADVPDAQLLVIHALGVHPAFARRGIAQRMVQYAIGTARSGLPRAAARRAGRQRPGRAALHRAGLCPPRHGADVLCRHRLDGLRPL